MPLRLRSAPPALLLEQCATQSQLVAQQAARLGDLEGVARQWEGRCADLRAAAAAHEARAKEAAGEVLKGNDALERLHVSDARLRCWACVVPSVHARVQTAEEPQAVSTCCCTAYLPIRPPAVAPRGRRHQSEVRLLKEKVKRKQAILVRQEEELAARDNQMAAAAREVRCCCC